MKPLFDTVPLVKNEEKKRFEIKVNGNYAFTRYSNYEGQLALVQTEMTPELAELGAGSALVGKILRHLEAKQLKMIPFCPFVFAYIQRYPAWMFLVKKNSMATMDLDKDLLIQDNSHGMDR